MTDPNEPSEREVNNIAAQMITAFKRVHGREPTLKEQIKIYRDARAEALKRRLQRPPPPDDEPKPEEPSPPPSFW